MDASTFGLQKDQYYMLQALAQAQMAFDKNEVPVGAVVVDRSGVIIAQAHNQTIHMCSQSAHAEIKALADAGVSKDDWRLEGCWLYVTLEPCVMCMGLIYLSRLEGVVYGASSPLFASRLDKSALLSVYRIDAVAFVSGVYSQEASGLLKMFFKQKRS